MREWVSVVEGIESRVGDRNKRKEINIKEKDQ